MIKNFLLLALFLASTSLLAQNPVSISSIFFETDQSELSAEARQTLDALAPALLQAPDYQVNIEAFTDDRGTAQHNLQLAADRAASVQQYLSEKGLVAEKTSVKNWGERKAAGPTDQARQKSRRVDVVVNALFFKDLDALQDRLSANTDQVFNIPSTTEQRLTTNKGTLLIVPANAFVLEDGSAPSGPIDIFIREAYDPSDFVQHNLSTMSDGHILQTGGMVSITAQSNGRNLELGEGQSLIVSIPNGGKFDPFMELFYAQPAANGGVDWKPAGQKFRKTLKPDRIELKIDPELGRRIAAIQVPQYPKPEYPVVKGELPPQPKMPVLPYKPRAPRKPEWAAAQKIFIGGGDPARLSRQELKKAQQYFNEQRENYVRDSAKYVALESRYQQNMIGYAQAKLRHISLQQDWERELYNRLRMIRDYQREMRLHYFATALDKALKSKSKTIHKYETYCNLSWSVEESANKITDILLSKNGLMDITDKKTKKRTEALMGTKLFQGIIGLKVIDGYENYDDALLLTRNTDTSDRIIKRMLASTGIKAISDSLKQALGEKIMLEAKSPQQANAAINGYVASISQLGWINCDRFYNDPSEKMQVMVNEADETKLFAVCKDINAMIAFSRGDEGKYYVNNLPKGKKITLVAIKIKDGMPVFFQSDMIVGEAAPEIAYKSMPLRDLKAALKKLNG